MQLLCVHVYLLLLFILEHVNIVGSAPCQQTTRIMRSYQDRICTSRLWGICTQYAWVWRYYDEYRTTCCVGYGGTNCQPICSNGCRGRGTCVAPEQCSCYSGYTGNACQTPVCSPICDQGTCIRPNTCSCRYGYTGRLCNTPICDPICEHGGTCTRPYTCTCPAGTFTGANCDKPICSPPCLNGGACLESRTCQCPSTYTGNDCGTPVCRPPCQNGGTCISPDTCSCDETYTGQLCETPLCSYHSPCFPGTCDDTVNCQCHEGFIGLNGRQRCRTMTPGNSPIITQCTFILANIDRTGQKMEKYRFVTDSSQPNSTRIDTMWVNQKDYNYINVEFAALFTSPENIVLPNYVTDFKFGIISGKIQILLQKVGRNDPNRPFVSQNETQNCRYQPGSSNPDDVFHCNFTDEKNFEILFENGDNLTLTVIAENGGFRELKTSTGHTQDYFYGQSSTKSSMFRFDFIKPHHFLQDKPYPCSSKALDVTEDITKSPIRFYWNNWIDELSGIHGYKLQVFLLKSNAATLTEPRPWNPDEEIFLNKSKSGYTYVPKQSGMFSFILNVIDNANNTQYARTLVLYDPLSNVTLSSTPFFATTAEKETNYKWQKSLNSNITMSWKGHFQNKFHHVRGLLNPVGRYLHYDFMTKYEKQVPLELDDKTGNRTLQRIPNVFGIVKFEYHYRNSNQGNRTPSTWIPISEAFSENQTFNIEKRDGDTINFWVKATDMLGNHKIDMTQISFDSSPPKELREADVIFLRNVKTTNFSFSSRLLIDTYDRDSGIHKIKWELIANNSNMVFRSGEIPGNKTNKELGPKLGYKIPIGDYYYYTHYLDINNCWMVVSKEKFATDFVLLKLTVFNMAMEYTQYNTTITGLASLDGMDQYSGPINLTIAATYDNGVRLKWVMPPTCYERTTIIVNSLSINGRVLTWSVDKNADWFDLTGLDPETNYNLSFITEYGRQMSDPVVLQFRTIAFPAAIASPVALTGGAIAGISIAFLILIGIIVAIVVLWKRASICYQKRHTKACHGGPKEHC